MSKITNELNQLYTFMDKYRNDKKPGSKPKTSHTIMFNSPKCKLGSCGAFFIPDSAHNRFMKLYTNALLAGNKLHIVERHREFGPIVIDLDFKESIENPKRKYTKVLIKKVVKEYTKIIKHCLDVNSSQLDAYVMEKPKPTLFKGEYKDGVHISFPYVCTRPDIQLVMRQKFIEYATKKDLFKGFSKESIDTIVDKSVIKDGGWIMYGSTKNLGYKPYEVTQIYQFAGGDIYETMLPGKSDKADIRHFVDCCSCRRFKKESALSDVSKHMKPSDMERALERNETRTKISNCVNLNFVDEECNADNALSEETFVDARNLIEMLSRERASMFHDWYQVGCCLHNLDHRLLADWIKFSKKTTRNNFQAGECEKLWKQMGQNRYTMASLHFFARKDSPKKYQAYVESMINTKLFDAMSGTNAAIIDYVKEKHKFQFVCSGTVRLIWYEFQGQRWEEMEGAYTLYNLLSKEIKNDFLNVQKLYQSKASEATGFNRESLETKAAQARKIALSLEDDTFLNKCIKHASKKLYDKDFLNSLDENIYLIGFSNGVYDLEADRFRSGCPDDYLTLQTKYPYVPYDENDVVNGEIDAFFAEIMPDPVIRKYLMTVLGIAICGSIEEQKFYILTGSGSNGKSKLMELMRLTLGKLFKPTDVRIIVGKRALGEQACPGIANKKGVRVTSFDEPGHNDELNCSFMKLFTGDEPITARDLYKSDVCFVPQFTPFLICNDTPEINTDDGGTWRRIDVIDFPAKFWKRSEATPKMLKEGLAKNHHWIDPLLSKKFQTWKQVFIGRLISIYQDYRKNGYKVPTEILENNKRYRRESDKYQDFLFDYFVKDDDESHFISLAKIHGGFRSWWRSNHGASGHAPSMKIVRNYLRLKVEGYDSKRDGLTGYTPKQKDDDESFTF